MGVATWLAFRWVGLEQAGVWAIAAGVFNSIPYFGPVIVAGGIAVVAFLQFGTIAMAALVAAISLAITSLEGWLLTPWLTSRASSTNDVAVFVGLIFWSFVWGVWGTLLAVPMLMVAEGVLRSHRGPEASGRAARRLSDLVRSGSEERSQIRIRPRACQQAASTDRQPCAIRAGHVSHSEVLDRQRRLRPRPTSIGVDTVARGRGRTE